MTSAFVCDQYLALTVRIRDLNRRPAGVWWASSAGRRSQPSLRFLLDSGLHVADSDSDAATEAPAARDVDDAAPLVTAEGRWAASWADFRSSLADASAILAVLQVPVGEWPPVHTLGASSRG